MTPNEVATVPIVAAILDTSAAPFAQNRSRTARSILRQLAFPRKREMRPRAQWSTCNAPPTPRYRFTKRSGPDPPNEVGIERRHLDTHTTDPANGAAADHRNQIFAPLMSSNDEVERRGVAPTQNEGT
jgi:hypothetical protein